MVLHVLAPPGEFALIVFRLHEVDTHASVSVANLISRVVWSSSIEHEFESFGGHF